MNFLLDTHTILWYLSGNKNISSKAKDAIENRENNKFCSIASLWEVAIKISLNKLNFDFDLNEFLKYIDDTGIEIIHISKVHIIKVSSLKFIHRDPFDRLIISQAAINNLTIITNDDDIKKYPISTYW
jgi:PIN domain nuclease of toxin-antitoxin system